MIALSRAKRAAAVPLDRWRPSTKTRRGGAPFCSRRGSPRALLSDNKMSLREPFVPSEKRVLNEREKDLTPKPFSLSPNALLSIESPFRERKKNARGREGLGLSTAEHVLA